MTFVKVFHNPTAGEAEHTREKLVGKLKAAGFDCSYSSTKKGINEKRIPAKTDIIAVAGGDGTVRSLADFYCNGRMLDKRHPIGLLPWGTANNIAFTLGINGSTEDILESWKKGATQNFDVGKIHGLTRNHFFLEGCGFGVFPKLVRTMKKRKSKSSDPEQELQTALQTLYQIAESYRAKECRINVDGVEYAGNFLMVEIMNIRSIGPNLQISPMGNSGDGEFDVILVSESQRDELLNYILDRLQNGKETPFFYTALKAKRVSIRWSGRLLHVDDELFDLRKNQRIEIEVLRDVFKFLV